MKYTILLFSLLGFYNLCVGQCWKEVSGGSSHSLGVKEDGTLWAWGRNNLGQLGNGTLTNQLIPIQIGTDNNWKIVSAGDWHSMAIKTDGTLWGWGNNAFYQLGDGTNIIKYFPTQIGTSNDWKFVDTGAKYTIALKTNGTLWVCGSNSQYVLGNGNVAPYQMIIGQLGSYSDWQSVSAASGHVKAIKNNGTLWSWGEGNSLGISGNGNPNGSTIPIQIGNETSWKSISAGWGFTAAIKLDGTLWTWGGNSWGQLGNNSLVESYVPIQVGIGTNWSKVSCMWGSAIGIKNDGTLWSWGENQSGQLGLGYISNHVAVPTQVGINNNWNKVSARGFHSCVIDSGGILKACGYNAYGQLGDNSITNSSSLIAHNCTALGEIDYFKKNEFIVYPNPSHSFVILDFDNKNQEHFQFEIFDIIGRFVDKGEGISGDKLDINKLNSGSYLLKVKIEEKFYVIKLLKK